MQQTHTPWRAPVLSHQARPAAICLPAAPSAMVQTSRRSLPRAAGADKSIQVPDEQQAAVAAERVIEKQEQGQQPAAEPLAQPAKSSSKGFGVAAKARAGSSKAKPSRQGKQGGRIDMVEVYDWGSGQQEQLGELKVKRVDTLYGQSSQQPSGPRAVTELVETATVSGTEGSTMSADTPSNEGVTSTAPTSFYEQLCQEMALAQRRGALEVAGPAPPPFTSWSFTPARYMQYLTDALAVHEALEAALPASSSSHSHHPHALLRLLMALHECGLGRAKAIQHDLAVLSAQHKAQVPAGAEQMAASHARQLQRWGRDVQQWLQWQEQHVAMSVASSHQPHGTLPHTISTSAPPAAPTLGQTQQDTSTATDEGKAAGKPPVFRDDAKLAAKFPTPSDEGKISREIEITGVKAAAALAAHAYALYVLHAAGGMRFGAVAAERLNLLPLDAAQFYHTYPPNVKDPLATLRAVLDASGQQLSCQQRNSVLSQLPDAVRSGSMLLTALAHTN